MPLALPRTLFSATLCALITAVSVPCAVCAESETAVSDKLNQLNVTFRENYSTAKQEIRRRLGPVIFVTGDHMTLLYKGERKTEIFIPDKYTFLKNVDHIPLMCYVALINKCERRLTADELNAIGSLADSIAAMETQLKTSQWQSSPDTTSGGAIELQQSAQSAQAEEQPRQLRMVRASLDLLEQVKNDKAVERSKLQKFARSVSSDAKANIEGAIGAQLARMQEITDKWRAEIPQKDWNNVHVVLSTGHMARDRMSAFQFFCDYLNEESEGSKIIVMEGLSTEEEGLDLLATHILDNFIAVDFFKDETIMHRDLLSGGAHRWLKKHKVGQPHR